MFRAAYFHPLALLGLRISHAGVSASDFRRFGARRAAKWHARAKQIEAVQERGIRPDNLSAFERPRPMRMPMDAADLRPKHNGETLAAEAPKSAQSDGQSERAKCYAISGAPRQMISDAFSWPG